MKAKVQCHQCREVYSGSREAHVRGMWHQGWAERDYAVRAGIAR